MRRFILSCLACLAMLAIPVFAQASFSIVSTDPTNGATGVNIGLSEIKVRFDTNDLDVGSFTGGNSGRVSVNNGASYTVSLEDGATEDYIIITLTAPLSYSTTYTVTINKKVRDNSNVQLGTTYQFTFTTMAKPSTDTTPPQVVSTFPLNGATGVSVSAVISVTFSEIMTTATIIDPATNITLKNLDSGSSVAGSVTQDGTKKIAYFTPSASLSSDTNYQVTVSHLVTDTAGNKLKDNADYVFVFRTKVVDTTPPEVLATSPINGATAVDPTFVDPITSATTITPVSAKFSEALDSATVASGVFTVTGSSGSVSGTVSYDATTWTLIFTPAAALANGTTFTATVTTAVTDQSGNHLAANKVWTFTTAAVVTPPPLADYCHVPSFLTNTTDLKPNVLLLIDNSGSMHEFAYKKAPDATCNYGSNCYDDSYSPTTDYYGYFENNKMYKYSSSGGYFEIDTTAALSKNSFWYGSFLNWLTMRRVDVVRQVLVGGKGTPRSGNTNYLIADEDPDRDHYKTYNNVKYSVEAGASTEVINDLTNSKTYKVKVQIGAFPDTPLLLRRQFADKINFGIMFFNDGYRFEDNKNSVRDGGFTAADIGATGNNLITQIEGTDPGTWTPLAESLYESIRYFEATTSAYNGGTYSGKDPITKPCQKNFVLILTDGESTKDMNIPGSDFTGGTLVTDPYGFDVKKWMDAIADNEGYTSQFDKKANTSDGTYFLEGVAYYAHMTDLRSGSVGKDNKEGNQNLTIYTVFAFDDSPIGEDLLRKTSKYGGFIDSNSDGKPDTQAEYDKDKDGDPDTFFKAGSGLELQKSLTKAFNDILARVSSGTAASILSNSEGSGANILQAMFYPKKFIGLDSADWIGELHNLWYYIDPDIQESSVREDTTYSGTPPRTLDLANDYIVNFFYDPGQQKTMVQRYQDAGGDGLPDLDLSPATPDGIKDSYTKIGSPIDPDEVKSLWRAGQRLFYRSPSARTIYTKLTGSGTLDLLKDYVADSAIKPYLIAANQTEADKIITYTLGTDQAGYRSRTVTISGTDGVWKLGDIISSTPRLQSSVRLNTYDRPPSGGYNDASYAAFLAKDDYKNRGMVYVGANDGMLHAFKLGNLKTTTNLSLKATLTGSNLGEEEWAFIPRNALPYLRYLGDTNYEGFNHLYFVDGSIAVADVSIGKPTGCDAATAYYDCKRDIPDTSNPGGTNWNTVLIGSMGLGGASKTKGAGCKTTTCVETPTLDPDDTHTPQWGLGLSSYFALDITDQHYDSSGNLAGPPKLLWEFSHPELGFSTSGAAIVKVLAKTDGNADRAKNGHWYAVVASGPTGKIDTTKQKFTGVSDQPLSIFVIDLATGELKTQIKTLKDGSSITNAFAGLITAAPIDTDKWDINAPGNYQDDALYIGYTQNGTSGGVLRLVTKEDPDPTKWVLSKVIDGIGPVTTNVSRLQDKKNKNLWLYFGTGRYFYALDDLPTQRYIAGVKEPCYTTANKLDSGCVDNVTFASLKEQVDASTTGLTTEKGWFISLGSEDTTNNLGAERSITDPVAQGNGSVFFTTFQPVTDVCGFGGNSYMWGVKYDTGLELPEYARDAKALVQVSTGSFEQINLSTALTNRGHRRTGKAMVGKPPADPPPIVSKANLKPVRKILHIEEK